MKFTKTKLKRIIKEELNAVLLLERVEFDEALAAQKAEKAVRAVSKALNQEWGALSEKLPAAAKAGNDRPVRDGLWEIWRKVYSTIKAVYDKEAAEKSETCCSYVLGLLEEADADFKKWVYSKETDPKKLGHAMYFAIKKATNRK